MAEAPRDSAVAQRILRAAIHLFAEKGFAATSTREIVEAAGITKPMLYYYFESKDGICRAALMEYQQAIVRDLHSVLDAPLEAREQLVEFVWAAFRFRRENPDFLRLAQAMYYGAQQEIPGVDTRRLIDEAMECFTLAAEHAAAAGLCRPGEEPILARMLDGAIAAWTRSPLLDDSVELTRELAEQVVDRLLYGVAPR